MLCAITLETVLHQVVNSIPALVFLVDEKEQFHYANHACLGKFSQLNPTLDIDIVGKSLVETLGEAAYSTIAPHIQNCLAGKIVRAEDRFTTASGQSLWLNISYIPHLDQQGNAQGLFIFAYDVSSEAQRYLHAERALRESEALYREALSNTSDAIFIATTAGKLTFICPNVSVIFGYSVEEAQAIGNIQTLLGAHFPDLSEMRAGEEVANIPVTINDRYGKVHELLVNVKGVNIQGGERLYTCRDVTELRRAERELKTFQEELHQMQKVEALGQMANGITHDFNNLLSIILGNLEILRLDFGDHGDARQIIDDIETAADQASRITRSLLDFSRHRPLQPEQVNLRELIEQFAAFFRRVLPDAIAFEVESGEMDIPVYGDATRLMQVLLNLAVNARDALEQGGRLRIAAERAAISALGKPAALLCVSDDGAGIDPNALEEIFRPFFTTKGEGKGTGLGLAIVKGIVDEHNGVIQVSSELGKGSTFTVVLPLLD